MTETKQKRECTKCKNMTENMVVPVYSYEAIPVCDDCLFSDSF